MFIDDATYFLIRDVYFDTAAAIISGCFLKRYISVLSPMNGAVFMLAQTITEHVVNRVIGGKKNIQESNLLRRLISVICSVHVATKAVAPNAVGWTFVSSCLISSVAKKLIL